MQDFLILLILAVVIVIAVRATIRHFRGEGGCCGSADYKAKTRKLPTVVNRFTFYVEGMHCQNCVNRVVEVVQSMDGTAASAKLKKGLVTVETDRQMEYDVIRQAIEKAGYTVTDAHA